MSLYPLLFTPRYLPKIWGGRKFEAFLNRQLADDQPTGESWEIFDFPPGVADSSDQWLSSVVANGPLAGKSLHQLVETRKAELLGRVDTVGEHGQFPLLIKFLDAREDLSVQVHPTGEYVEKHLDAHLKTEAWYVVQADDNSRLLVGLKPETTEASMKQAIADGTVEAQLKSIPAREGDCHYLPSGTVHALGAGMLVAEVQTPSDTTFRLFDFNRVDPSTGRQRKLHIDEALQCIQYGKDTDSRQPRQHVAGLFTTVSRLVQSPFFRIEKVRFADGVEQEIPYDDPVIWMILDGQVEVACRDLPEPVKLTKGRTVLLPADMRDARVKCEGNAQWLEITMNAGQE